MTTEPTPTDLDPPAAAPDTDDTSATPGTLPPKSNLAIKMRHLHETIQKRKARAAASGEGGKKVYALSAKDEEELSGIVDPEMREAERRRRLWLVEEADKRGELGLTQAEISRKRLNEEYPHLKEPASEKKQVAKLLPEPEQLPLWPEQTRGTPNSFLRGALFAAIQGKERRALKGELLASQPGIEIRFTGWQLDQYDLDVWEQAIQLAAKHPLGNQCLFKIRAFLRGLGRKDGKSERDSLMDSFRRIAACCVEIKHGPHTYGGSMLEFWHDAEADTYRLQQNPRILALYQAGWTALDWEKRGKLHQKPLALWLFGWLSSHAENYPTKVETIRKLCGSRDKTLFGFRRNLKAALSALQTETVLTGWAIDPKSDLVTTERTPSASQQRHLIKKITKPQKPKP